MGFFDTVKAFFGISSKPNTENQYKLPSKKSLLGNLKSKNSQEFDHIRAEVNRLEQKLDPYADQIKALEEQLKSAQNSEAQAWKKVEEAQDQAAEFAQYAEDNGVKADHWKGKRDKYYKIAKKLKKESNGNIENSSPEVAALKRQLAALQQQNQSLTQENDDMKAELVHVNLTMARNLKANLKSKGITEIPPPPWEKDLDAKKETTKAKDHAVADLQDLGVYEIPISQKDSDDSSKRDSGFFEGAMDESSAPVYETVQVKDDNPLYDTVASEHFYASITDVGEHTKKKVWPANSESQVEKLKKKSPSGPNPECRY